MNIRLKTYDLTIDTTVNTDTIIRFSDEVTWYPITGKIHAFIPKDIIKPVIILTAVSTADPIRVCTGYPYINFTANNRLYSERAARPTIETIEHRNTVMDSENDPERLYQARAAIQQGMQRAIKTRKNTPIILYLHGFIITPALICRESQAGDGFIFCSRNFLILDNDGLANPINESSIFITEP